MGTLIWRATGAEADQDDGDQECQGADGYHEHAEARVPIINKETANKKAAREEDARNLHRFRGEFPAIFIERRQVGD